MTEQEKSRMVEEERTRSEAPEEWTKAKRRGHWEVANSPLVLCLLSSGLLSLIAFGYTRQEHLRQERVDNKRQADRITQELRVRLLSFADALATTKADLNYRGESKLPPGGLFHQLRVAHDELKDPEKPYLSEFKGKNANSLFTDLADLAQPVDDAKAKALVACREGLDDIAREVEKGRKNDVYIPSLQEALGGRLSAVSPPGALKPLAAPPGGGTKPPSSRKEPPALPPEVEQQAKDYFEHLDSILAEIRARLRTSSALGKWLKDESHWSGTDVEDEDLWGKLAYGRPRRGTAQSQVATRSESAPTPGQR